VRFLALMASVQSAGSGWSVQSSGGQLLSITETEFFAWFRFCILIFYKKKTRLCLFNRSPVEGTMKDFDVRPGAVRVVFNPCKVS